MEIRAGAALILIDQQKGIHHPRLGRRNNPHAEERMQALLGHWRREGWPVVHVQHLSHSAEAVHAMSLGNLHGEYATVISSRQLLE